MIENVCIFGDSVAKGVIFDSVKNKYSLLKESFANIVQQSQSINISNYAKFGCTISMGNDILRRHEKQLSNFDFTFLEFGGNDCDYNWAEISDQPFKQHLAKTPLTQFREQYISLIERVKENGGIPVLFTLPPIDSKRYFQWVSKGLNGKNILAYLGSIDAIHAWQGLYSKAVTEIAATCKIPVIDIRSAFLEKQNYCEYLCEDGIHPNKKGHLLISSTIDKRTFV
jgi:lysophospholipase L1-like esterase